ncbi:hypothetical protein [Saccharopolyspora rosea]|uniref:Secreted protein n=1 Tax=Saccharopolyspora rosea TaxID=524884 RepID=A0ABW3FJL2_9PSEU|nr:hypothetical protein [Saccharopolyspora rosea]
MRIRKTVTTLALCVAGMSVLGAGTALAVDAHPVEKGQFPSLEACKAEGHKLEAEDPNVVGSGCEDWEHDGSWLLTVMVKN